MDPKTGLLDKKSEENGTSCINNPFFRVPLVPCYLLGGVMGRHQTVRYSRERDTELRRIHLQDVGRVNFAMLASLLQAKPTSSSKFMMVESYNDFGC